MATVGKGRECASMTGTAYQVTHVTATFQTDLLDIVVQNIVPQVNQIYDHRLCGMYAFYSINMYDN